MGVELRVAESDEDLERRRQVRLAILPNERCLSVAEMRAMATAETLHLVAELDGVLRPVRAGRPVELRLRRARTRRSQPDRAEHALTAVARARGPLPLQRPGAAEA